jgi:hypothetical protein
MVIAPASTGRDNKSKTVVIKIDHTNSGVLAHPMPSRRMLMMVVIKLIAPRIDLAPAKWRLKIVKSTEALPWASAAERGG